MDSKLMKSCLTHPGGRPSSSNQRSLVSEIGDAQKTSEKLMFALVSIKFPHHYDEAQ